MKSAHKAKGSTRMNMSGLRQRVQALERLVAERDQTIEALRVIEARFRLLAENAKDVIYRYRLAPDRGFEYVSPACEQMFGYTPQEFYAEPRLAFRLIHPDDRQDYFDPDRPWDVEPSSLTMRYRRKDGATRWAEANRTPVFDDNGDLVAVEGIIRDVTERVWAEAALRRSEERLRDVSRRLVEVQESERRSIALELHDEIGQGLTAVTLLLDRCMSSSGARRDARMSQAKMLLRGLMSQVRELAHGLRPGVLDDLGLLHALLWHTERFTSQTGVHVSFQHRGLDSRFEAEVETAAYRIVQEALTNVARHSQAKEATVRLWVDESLMNVQIVDEGVGFDPPEDSFHSHGIGLNGLRERATALGGRLQVDSAPGRGTRLTAELPMRRQERGGCHNEGSHGSPG